MARAAQTTRQRTAQIERRFKETNRSATAQMVSLAGNVRGALLPILGPAAGLFTAAGLGRGVRSAVSDLSSLGKTARDVGLDVEELQGLMRGFARSTRASEEQVAAFLERFNRRIGEAVNGMGPLNSTLERYGISVRRANGEVKSQSELLRDVANAIRNARTEQERAAIAQAAGGDVGRQLAAALAEGADGIERMTREAREAGDVIDRDLIQRAELLDDRFGDLTRRVGTFFKTLAVGAVGGLAETPVDVLERLFGDLESARRALGDDLLDALTADVGVVDQFADGLGHAAAAAEDLRARSDGLVTTLDEVARALLDINEEAAARALLGVVDDINDSVIAFREGRIGADEFADAVRQGGRAAFDTANGVREIDTATLGRVMQAVNALTGALRAAQGAAAGLNAEMGKAPRSSLSLREDAIAESGATRDATRAFIAEQERQRSLTTDQIALEREMDSLRRDAGRENVALTEAQIAAQARLNIARAAELRGGAPSGGSSGGGGSARASEFERAVAAVQEQTAAYEAEAVAILAAAAGGREYGDAVEYARQRARLLLSAQRAGLSITPELEAMVDRLADAHVRAGNAARDSADRMREAQDQARRGAEAMTNLFMSIARGGDQARQAVAQLLAQIAQVQLMRAIMQGAPGFSGTVGALLGFSGGGYTGDGHTHAPAGVVHKGEYVFSKKAVRAAGLDRLDALHAAMSRFSSGGGVGARRGAVGAALGAAPQVHIHNHAGAEVTAAASRNAAGDVRLDVIVDKVAHEVGQRLGSGSYDGPMKRFGALPKKVIR